MRLSGRTRLFVLKRLLPTILLSSGLMIPASQARAGIISYSHTESSLMSGISNGNFFVPQYADAGGMPLTKVTLTIEASSTGGLATFDNESPSAGMAFVSIGTSLRLRGPTPASAPTLEVEAQPQSSNTAGFAPDNDGAPPDFTGSDSVTVIGTLSADFESSWITASDALGPYRGNGLVSFSFIASTSARAFGVPLPDALIGATLIDTANFRPTSAFTATISYEFVPEPSSILLAGIGFLGLAARGWRLTRSDNE